MVAAATTLRDIIETQWGLTGELSKVSTGSGVTLMDEVVQFWDRKQVSGNEVPKSVTVEKINDEGNETIVRHPNFNEISDIYEVTVYYRVIDVDEDNFSTSLNDIEDMAKEVVRILRTIYNPSVSVGIYFRTTNEWTNEDMYTGNQPELRRKLRFHLTTITSDSPQVFSGFGGVLSFDTTLSQGDSKPANDYIFAEVESVDISEGYAQNEVYTKDKTKGVGVPRIRRGRFRGLFTAVMYAKRDDIEGTTIEKLENIYKTQANPPFVNQNSDIVFLHANPNTQTGSKVTFIFLTDRGSGFTSAPTVSITGGGGSGATAVAIISNGQVVSIVITTNGSSYESVPTVTISGGSGTGAKATASIAVSLTTTSFMKINSIKKLSTPLNLVKYSVTGKLTKPTDYEVIS